MTREVVLAVSLAAVLTVGCTTTKLLDFSMLSDRTVPLEHSGRLSVSDNRVSGEDAVAMYLIFPIGTLDVGEALARAIDSVPNCVGLRDGSITREDRMFLPFIYADSKVIVEGFPVLDSEGSP